MPFSYHMALLTYGPSRAQTVMFKVLRYIVKQDERDLFSGYLPINTSDFKWNQLQSLRKKCNLSI